MEPVTHLLTGGCLARAGLNRMAAYATPTLVLAAELPDIDTLWALRGPIEGFQHHRGITHTFAGVPVEAALLVAAVYGWHRWRERRGRRAGEERARERPIRESPGAEAGLENQAGLENPAGMGGVPVRWGVLYGLALVGLLSHVLLDFTNSYGVRPFFPFEDRWYAGSIVFLFDPVIFALLAGALALPWLFGLVGSEVGARRAAFPARGWAVAALLGVAGWWGLRAVEHGRALRMAMAQSVTAPSEDGGGSGNGAGSGDGEGAGGEAVPRYLEARRALAGPDPVSPFRWSAVMDFGPMYAMAEVDTGGSGTLTMGETTYRKPGRSAAVETAEASRLGRVYMDWSAMPIVEVTRADGVLAGGGGSGEVERWVTFRDPRFMGGWMRDEGRTAMEGAVGLDAEGRVVRERLEGSF